MHLVKSLLLLCAFLAIALARPDHEDRESHRAHKHAVQRDVSEDGENAEPEYAVRCQWRDPRKPACAVKDTYCLRDDWRCIADQRCDFRGGWCVPYVREKEYTVRCQWQDPTKPVCAEGQFCLRDDWRCLADQKCLTKGGWCIPLDKEPRYWSEGAKRTERISSRDESEEPFFQMRAPLLLVLLLSTFTCVSPFKILVYIPKFAISHIKFMGVIADTLVDAGHNVTALVSEMDAALIDGTKKASIIRISPAEGADHMNTHFMTGDTDMFEMESDSWRGAMENAHHNSVSFVRQCRKLLQTPGLMQKLRDEHFDAIITENFENCGVGLSHQISARSLIVVSSTMLIGGEHMGVPLSFFSDRSAMSDGHYHDTLYSRIMHVYNRLLFSSFIATQDGPLQKVFDELHPGTPTFSELISRAAVVLPNIEPLTNVAGPTLAKIVPIGGITVGKPKPLDDYWNIVLSHRPKTVFVSFGSIAKSVLMKPARKTALLEAFASFPDTTFIWKYENSTDFFATFQAAKVPNVVLTEWAPQLDLLADRRLSLFISHGGMASCHELSTFGVPSLLVPIFGDQPYNTAGLVHSGIAEVFNKFDMTDARKIRNAIGNMLSNPSYKVAADRIRDQLAARPSTPKQQLVSHVEFAARFGPSKSLRPLSLDLSPIQFWGVDLVVVGLISMLLVVVAVVALLYFSRALFSIVEIRKVHKKVE